MASLRALLSQPPTRPSETPPQPRATSSTLASLLAAPPSSKRGPSTDNVSTTPTDPSHKQAKRSKFGLHRSASLSAEKPLMTNPQEEKLQMRELKEVKQECEWPLHKSERAGASPLARSPSVSSSDSPLPSSSLAASAHDLVAPRLSRHNDAAYYPNIKCILCGEWVCSRNRFMHIESHLQYRPYKCSACGYDNRKEIFVALHIKKSHAEEPGASLTFRPDPDLEHKAWEIAEQCLQHTREVLMRRQEAGDEAVDVLGKEEGENGTPKGAEELNDVLSEKYVKQYRPRIFNLQRATKSDVIEKAQMGALRNLSEIASMEVQCQVPVWRVHSDASVEKLPSQTHEGGAQVQKARGRPPRELSETTRSLREGGDPRDVGIAQERRDEAVLPTVTKTERRQDHADRPEEELPQTRLCTICSQDFIDSYQILYCHVKSHLSEAPYKCSECVFTSTESSVVGDHMRVAHPHNVPSHVLNRMNEKAFTACIRLLHICFPGVEVCLDEHDPAA